MGRLRKQQKGGKNRNDYNDNESNCIFIIGEIQGFDIISGDSDFAKMDIAGTSKQWIVHLYASAVFNDNIKSTYWTSGIDGKHGNASLNYFTSSSLCYAKTRKVVSIFINKNLT